jgi:hypothetical protein
MARSGSTRFPVPPDQTDKNNSDPSVAGRKTLSVPEAGRIYFELGRNASYAAAARGEIPTLKVGSRLRVPVLALERMLETTRSPEIASRVAHDATRPQPLGGPACQTITSSRHVMGLSDGTQRATRRRSRR